MIRSRWLASAILGVLFWAVVGQGTARAEEGPLVFPDQAAFDAAVEAAIRRNPGMLLEAIEAHQAAEQARAEAEAAAAIASAKPAIIADPDNPRIGPADAEITLIEFFDYECGYCKRMWPDMQRALDEIPGLRVVFMEFPILSETSEQAARAALAADRQGMYAEFHDALMRFNGRKNMEALERIATRVGLDVEQLKADMDDPAIAQHISEVRELARSFNIRGTPALIIGDNLFPGAIGYDQIVTFAQAAAAEGG